MVKGTICKNCHKTIKKVMDNIDPGKKKKKKKNHLQIKPMVKINKHATEAKDFHN